MPYIDTKKRIIFKPPIDCLLEIFKSDIISVGDLTYIFYQISIGYIKQKGLRFSTLSEIVAALECTKQELYRKIISPYENKKIEENGDITL